MAEIVKDDFIMYNSFVVYMFNLTEKDVEMTRDEFCKAVAKICNNTWVFPSEFKTADLPEGPEEWTENDELCMTKCKKDGEAYHWCWKFSKSWDYCTPGKFNFIFFPF